MNRCRGERKLNQEELEAKRSNVARAGPSNGEEPGSKQQQGAILSVVVAATARNAGAPCGIGRNPQRIRKKSAITTKRTPAGEKTTRQRRQRGTTISSMVARPGCRRRTLRRRTTRRAKSRLDVDGRWTTTAATVATERPMHAREEKMCLHEERGRGGSGFYLLGRSATDRRTHRLSTICTHIRHDHCYEIVTYLFRRRSCILS
ncbi:hypothetical protein Scep_028546 [Stephania cephalantha]|uniref:Uncharacterized protein n=1 Tax=Stephania cephalantha TaxID=152367 RepID=A0AAP0EA57_9MAGN